MSKKYFLESTRLDSFRPKRRSSVAGNGSSKSVKWPHPDLLPTRFAAAGFYFDPTQDNGDNVTCYLCSKSLEGWAPGEDPVNEHYRHSKDCGWAITAYTFATTVGKYTCDPHGEKFTQARLMTFGHDMWPHQETENLSVMNMVNAGFHYAPTKDEADYCLCPFCEVSLANFEPQDDPRHEHYRRAPTCYFFTTEPSKKQKKRAPRVSTVPKRQTRRASRAPKSLEDHSQSARGSVDNTDDEDPPPKVRRRKRAGSAKPKLATSKKAGRKKAAAEPPIQLSEPEDPPKRGRKRSSSVISKEPTVLFDGRDNTDEDEIVVQPKKQRPTRASTVRPLTTDYSIEPPRRQRTRASMARQTSHEMSLTDTEDFVAVVAAKQKGRRTASKSKTLVKTPAKHKAYMLTNKDLDCALELELERPLTDEDESTPHQTPFVRSTKRLTRSRASLAVEQQMRDAPSNILIPTASRVRGKLAEPGSAPAAGKTPLKSFFKGNQDFSIPIKIPRHLNDQDIAILDQHNYAPIEVKEEETASQGPLKRPRGRPPKSSSDQRTETAKKKDSTRSKPAENGAQPVMYLDGVLSQAYEAPLDESIEKPQSMQQSSQTIQPKRRPNKQQRNSVASLVSMISDDMLAQENAAPMDPTEPHESEVSVHDNLSDSGSVVRHQIVVQDTFDDSAADVPCESEEEGAHKREQSITRPTRNGTRRSTISKYSPGSEQFHEVETQRNTEEDVEYGGGHNTSAVSSSPSQEVTSPLRESAQTHEMDIDQQSEVFLPEKTNTGNKESTRSSENRPLNLEDERSVMGQTFKMAEQQTSDLPEEHSPARGDSPEQSRLPLSPIRKQLQVPLLCTPRTKKPRTLQTSQPWSPIDLDVVFAAQNSVEDVVTQLSDAERGMTVEEWVKWNAENTSRRLNETAERIIAIFEEKGRRGIAAIEGIPTS